MHETYASPVKFLMSCQSALALHKNLHAALSLHHTHTQCGVTVHHTAVHHCQAHGALSVCLQQIVIG